MALRQRVRAHAANSLRYRAYNWTAGTTGCRRWRVGARSPMISAIRHLERVTMAPPRQGNLFGDDELADLFGDEPPPPYRPDLDEVRAKLHKMLAEARAADKLPPRTVSLYRTIVPHMTTWLPEDEGTQLRFEFETELKRLEAA